ncbi:TIGR02530 family flagellar biosynthesis protein [Halalkalibacter nanhaiisediminis]|uniref:Flagellar operon protein n=1 Tax=Halalkalibacter nanhaiisediminis TaxID=688079 RepID=A0A562QEK0_9BACI|nr:TIGR02530 family flagellar biosynthesis protein [Halalkalibacter nanhaiisediminis]TWI55164.1 flagellar operon protein [Halalkalibacter nanhaiisediminis]
MDPRIHSKSLHALPKPINRPINHTSNQTTPFQQFLKTELQGTTELKLSKHAKQRMDMRGIEFSTEKWMTIQEKVSEAKKKGVHDSLVLTNEAALVVSTKNNTVITVLNREEAQSQIFTNINGTIVID